MSLTRPLSIKISHSQKILSLLKSHYPHAKIVLNYSSPWELLVAVILSAQCTDKTVNLITEKLFKKYKRVEDYASANQEEFEKDIRSAGFFRNKAKNILATAKLVVGKWGGQVPENLEDLLTLPGVARKTANVIQGNAWGRVEGIAVDTHVLRLSQRLGFTQNKTPEKIEQDLMKLFPKGEWFKLTYLLIDHGRALCKAPTPLCSQCFLNKICPSSLV